MSRHFVGWTPPPRPYDVIPSISSGLSQTELIRRVLIDFAHDDGLRSAFYMQPGNREYFIFSDPDNPGYGQAIAEAKLNLSQLIKANPQANVSNVTQFWKDHDIDKKISNAAHVRLKLGPLPPNVYSGDPIIIYYYDNDKIKRVKYPRSSISSASGYALDPYNKFWWKGNGIATEQKNSDGSWGDEGFDWNKDAEGALGAISTAIMTIIGAVLIATGVGAAAGAAITAFSAALIAEANLIATAVSGGDISKAVGGLIDAFTKLLGAELPSGVLSQIGKAAISALNVQLKTLVPVLQKTQGLSFSSTYSEIQKVLPNISPVSDHAVSAITTLLGSASAPFETGYKVVDYADVDTVNGLVGIINDVGAQTLFKLGAIMGLLRKHQKTAAKSAISGRITMLPISSLVVQHTASARADLVNFITKTLRPRYHF